MNTIFVNLKSEIENPLSLPLLVLGVGFADNKNSSFPANGLAVLAYFLGRGSNFHKNGALYKYII
jgi:hypothetical protein